MSPNDDAARTDATGSGPVHRRRFLALAGGVGVAALAGCAGDGATGGNGADDPTDAGTLTDDPATAETGTFRLLISDQPAAIDDFDSLNVSFDRARVFRDGGDDSDDEAATEAPEGTATSTPEGTETAAATETATATPDEDATEVEEEDDEDDGEDEEDESGFTVIDLEGATVDLTQVLGEKALGVFEGGLPAGRYTKIELYAADVEGIVDGEPADVKIPSGKLQIVTPFEIEAGETLEFVFDINVVRKGNGGYNLLPVISESGVAGEDVEVEEVDEEGDDDDDEATDDGAADEEEEATATDDDGTATGGQTENGTAAEGGA